MSAPSDILAALDALASEFQFPGFNNMNYETADARMHLFRATDGRWSLLIEEAVDWPGAGGPMTILFGAGPLTAGGPGLVTPFPTWLEAAFDDDSGDLASATLRGHPIDLGATRERAVRESLPVGFALLLVLSDERREELFQSAFDLRSMCVHPDGQHLLTIEAWCHPDVYGGPSPSESEAFQLVAETLASGDVTRWQPTERANNRDYRHWLASR